ncbi:MAG: hypothetical protein OXJ90_17785 [Spirochaetaceae bacterium]|nr:hypothetical protein [Spirochaetaceae bacterium]
MTCPRERTAVRCGAASATWPPSPSWPVNAPAALRFDIFYALSTSRYRWLDADHTREVLGFEPADRAEDHLAG